MKITKRQLRKIILEEFQAVQAEGSIDAPWSGQLHRKRGERAEVADQELVDMLASAGKSMEDFMNWLRGGDAPGQTWHSDMNPGSPEALDAGEY